MYFNLINVLQKALLIKEYLVQSSLITTNSKTFRIIQYFFMLRPPALHKEAVFGTSNQLLDIHGNLDIDITDIKIPLHNTVMLIA